MTRSKNPTVDQREERKREIDAKLQGVQQRAEKAKGDAKVALEARVAELRHEYELGKARQAAMGGTGSHH